MGNVELVRITAPHFVAGLVWCSKTDRVTEAAPILKYMHGWSRERVSTYCTRKGWAARMVTPTGDTP